jgi:hypothetical protein
VGVGVDVDVGSEIRPVGEDEGAGVLGTVATEREKSEDGGGGGGWGVEEGRRRKSRRLRRHDVQSMTLFFVFDAGKKKAIPLRRRRRPNVWDKMAFLDHGDKSCGVAERRVRRSICRVVASFARLQKH